MRHSKRHLSRLTLIALTLLGTAAYAGEKDDLFGDDLPKASAGASPKADPKTDPKASLKPTSSRGPGIKGFVQFELARTIADPDHWSKMRTRADLSSQGKLSADLKWKLGVRLDYDAVFDIDDFYNAAVKKDQRFDAALRENYLDYSAGNWDFRIGRQHIVWGEMVGLFFADVVSARDMREFILPDFDQLRTPQWAIRSEYFKDDFHAELLWIPVASYDNIGKPGAEFYPYQPVPAGFNVRYQSERRPERNADNMNYGLRLSTLKNGWDISGFYYRSTDINATFYRDAFSQPGTLIYQARHDRIDQWGSSLAKDFDGIVLKGEAVYTKGRSFTSLNPLDRDGVTAQNTLDWAAGLDFTLPAESRLNAQIFQRQFFNYQADIIADHHENGFSLLANSKFFNNWEVQALLISSINRSDRLFRPRATWNFERNWRWVLGADIFKGPPLGMFGRYDQQDRVYSELRYSF